MKNSAGRNVRKTQPAVKVCERSFAMSRHHQRENPRCEAAARVMATEGGHLNQSTDRLDSRPHIKPVHMSIWFYMQCNLRAGCIKPERHHNSRGLGSSGCKMSWWVQRIILLHFARNRACLCFLNGSGCSRAGAESVIPCSSTCQV